MHGEHIAVGNYTYREILKNIVILKLVFRLGTFPRFKLFVWFDPAKVDIK